jgi:Arc/MetJ family transcription regulator
VRAGADDDRGAGDRALEAVHHEVYPRGMSRTNIDIDDELIEKVMERFRLQTKRAAVDFALRRTLHPLADRVATREEILAMQGMGWGGDLDEMRDAPVRQIFEAVEE